MSRRIKKRYVTPEEYLAFERAAEHKSEYLDGEIFAMTGASREHNLITLNVASELRSQLKGRDCEVYPSDMRVRIPSANVYTYPDVVVVCGGPKFEDAALDTLLNPTLLVEVLSKSTENYDRTVKFAYYRSVESLAEYLLVAQDACRVEHYARQADGRWSVEDHASPDSPITLASIGCALRLTDVYERVEL
jgi:Uma2 family endonuclease